MSASPPPVALRVRVSDGHTLVAHDYGHGSSGLVSRDCLLLHGNGLPARAYERLSHNLRAAGLRVVAVDLRGGGESACQGDNPPQPSSLDLCWPRMAKDVLELVSALGLQRGMVAVGHSLGGCCALLASAAAPGLFSALFLYEPIVIPAAGKSAAELAAGSAPLVAMAKRRRASFPSRADAQRAYAAKPPFSLFHPTCLADYVQHGFEERADGSVTLRCTPETEAEIFRQGGLSGCDVQLHRVGAHVTVAVGGAGWHGAQDDPARYGERVARDVPCGRLTVFERLDHNGLLCDPDAVAVAVLASFAMHPQSRL
jgi:pimeloyl-ACP methyl ester carboxylesterase